MADDPVTGKPRVFLSKGHKARYLKERGLMEAGDKVRGAFAPAVDHPQKQDNRALVAEALHQVKQMGRDYRRQEYLRIVKEGQKHAKG